MNFTRRLFSLMLAAVLFVSCFAVSASAAGTIMHGIGFVNTTSLRLRSEATTGSAILDTAHKNDCVVIISKDGDWYKVNYNLQEGYMHADYLDVLTRENAELGYGKVNGSGVNLRSGPSTSYRSVGTAAKGSKCYILGLNQGWYKVIYNTTICYIRSDYVDLTEIPYENRDSANSPKFYRGGKSTGVAPSAAALNGSTGSSQSSGNTAANVTGSQILAEAKKYLGTPYVYGGASPAGFDCSGFVYYVLKQLGFSPYRTPASQYNQGTYISKDNLQVGDIVFFAGTYASGISHVGIYAGNGQFIHSPNSRSTVSYSDLTSGYWAQHYYGARRMS
ncbi:MAG: C40 family peptidase [Oscillospiraceae bacterium]|nr:C40 family peptidase [Oscillospiraceae bacterium]MBQ7129489.1 C40 family peptidase [Oscillospiraceae bacterium]